MRLAAVPLFLLASAHWGHAEILPVDLTEFGRHTPLDDLPHEWGSCTYNACSSPAERQGYSDCWAGFSLHERCSCTRGYPRSIGRNLQDSNGQTRWEYACCEIAPRHEDWIEQSLECVNEDIGDQGSGSGEPLTTERCSANCVPPHRSAEDDEALSVGGLIIILLFWGCVCSCSVCACRAVHRRCSRSAQQHPPQQANDWVPMQSCASSQAVHSYPVHGQPVMAQQPGVQMGQPVAATAMPVATATAMPMPIATATPMPMTATAMPIAVARPCN